MAKIYPLDLNKNCPLDDVHVAKTNKLYNHDNYLVQARLNQGR